MSGVATQQNTNLAGNKRRSLSGQGGLLNRMFGNSGSDGGNGKEGGKDVSPTDATDSPQSPKLTNHISAIEESKEESKDEVPSDMRSPTRKTSPEDTADKKRRSSGVGRARDLFSSAKQSLRDLGGSPDSRPDKSQTPMQRLGMKDPALSVPHGSFNNSAGESVPGPRSTFRVGVTEDKNKKCRRTMEDTHAYLYNFLSTPAPGMGSQTSLKPRNSMASSTASASNLSPVDSGASNSIETDNGYFAIFDGHAGTFAAEWCGKKVHVLLEDIIRRHPNTPIPELLDMTFTSVDNQLEKLPLKNSGCTAVIAVLRWEDRIPNSQSATGSTAIAPAAAQAAKEEAKDGESQSHEDAAKLAEATAHAEKLREKATRQRVLYTANVGDARIVLCRNGKALRLSYDHKGSDENEGKRIAGAGGLILNNRVNGVLAVTRALGDAYMKDLVTGHPYTTETVVQPDIDEFLILACDGLWDVCSDQEAVDLVRNQQDPQVASKALVDHALARFSTDNLSCMIVRFDNKAIQETVEKKAEPIGVEGDPGHAEGGLSETDRIVQESRKKLEEAGVPDKEITKAPDEIVESERNDEPPPQVNMEALKEVAKEQAAKEQELERAKSGS